MARNGSKPTTSRRAEKQTVKDRYAHAREDAQLLDLIPTKPEEALTEERVDPSSQEEQSLPSLDRRAVMDDWSVPAEKKPLVIKRLLEPFEEETPTRVIKNKDGEVIATVKDNDHRMLISRNARVLLAADQRQYERDHPEEAGKAKGAGGTSTVNVNVFDWANILKQVEGKRPDEVLQERLEAPLQQTTQNGLKEINND